MKFVKLIFAFAVTSMLAGCTPVWDMENTSKANLEYLTKTLESWGYVVNPLEKGCGIGIDCNDPNYKLVAGKPAIEDSHQNQCLVAIEIASSAGMTKWGTSEEDSKDHDLASTKNEALKACEAVISKIPKFEGESGFAEADSDSIEFFGEFTLPHVPSAPGEMSFRASVQREDGESGQGTKTFVMLASTTYMQ
jgi:hypothetical protein